MTKYQEYFQKMLTTHKELFDSFRIIHDKYQIANDTETLQEEFNKEGEKIMVVIHDWENKLCSQSEKGGFGHFTGNLAEKFQAMVKKEFPMIDHIGIIVKPFNLKHITFRK